MNNTISNKKIFMLIIYRIYASALFFFFAFFQNNVSVSKVTNSLESLRKVKIPASFYILDAYRHFEALTSHNYRKFQTISRDFCHTISTPRLMQRCG